MRPATFTGMASAIGLAVSVYYLLLAHSPIEVELCVIAGLANLVGAVVSFGILESTGSKGMMRGR